MYFTFLCDLFSNLENNYLTNYADDTTASVICNHAVVVSDPKDFIQSYYLVCQNEIRDSSPQ